MGMHTTAGCRLLAWISLAIPSLFNDGRETQMSEKGFEEAQARPARRSLRRWRCPVQN